MSTARSSMSLKNRTRRYTFRTLTIACTSYVLLLAMISFCENYLIYPGWLFRDGDWNPSWLSYEDVWFTSQDGTRLHGWYLEHPNAQGYLLYCHGNGEHVANLAQHLDDLRREHQLTVFAFDYRGYGQSAGSPHEQGVLADGRAAHRWFAKRAGIPPQNVLLMGRSLGGAVAVELASSDGAQGLILERTFTSLPDAAARLYWWAPVKLIMRNKFRSIDRIQSYHGPLLQSHGTADELIPLDLGEQLFAACPSQEKTFISMVGVNHNGQNSPDYEHALGQFFNASRLSPAGR